MNKIQVKQSIFSVQKETETAYMFFVRGNGSSHVSVWIPKSLFTDSRQVNLSDLDASESTKKVNCLALGKPYQETKINVPCVYDLPRWYKSYDNALGARGC